MIESKYQTLILDVNRSAAVSSGLCVLDFRLVLQAEVVLHAFESGRANEQHSEILKMDKITFVEFAIVECGL